MNNGREQIYKQNVFLVAVSLFCGFQLKLTVGNITVKNDVHLTTMVVLCNEMQKRRHQKNPHIHTTVAKWKKRINLLVLETSVSSFCAFVYYISLAYKITAAFSCEFSFLAENIETNVSDKVWQFPFHHRPHAPWKKIHAEPLIPTFRIWNSLPYCPSITRAQTIEYT